MTPAAPPGPQPPDEPPGGAPRVLLVDDDATIRRFVALALEDLPLQLVPCASAAEARDALRRGPAVLVITDLMMPGESGFELLASLVAEPGLRGGARLAVFSAGLNAETRARLAGLDVWRELDKPVSVAALESCVNEALALAVPAAVAGEAAGGVLTPDPSAGPEAAPAQPAASAGELSAAEQAAVAHHFDGDVALFLAFRALALPQFELDRAALAQAMAAADWPAVRRQAHSLKGALATLGDDRGAALARALEDAAAAAAAEGSHRMWLPLQRHLASAALRPRDPD